jgi:Cation transporter/ATPase, N-terminus
MEAPWTKSPEDLLQHFHVSSGDGLSPDQVKKHAQIYGTNGRLSSLRSETSRLTSFINRTT